MVAAAVRELRVPGTHAEEYLGPAEVIEVSPSDITALLPSGHAVGARLALAFPYRPAVGDSLLVIGRGSNHYVIGVLSGSGATALAFEGDVELRASRGRLTLAGDKGVEVRGPEVELNAGTLRMLAQGVVQKFESVYQRVSAMLRVHAGETQTLVDEDSFTQAKNATVLTEDVITMNGREIHMG